MNINYDWQIHLKYHKQKEKGRDWNFRGERRFKVSAKQGQLNFLFMSNDKTNQAKNSLVVKVVCGGEIKLAMCSLLEEK